MLCVYAFFANRLKITLCKCDIHFASENISAGLKTNVSRLLNLLSDKPNTLHCVLLLVALGKPA
jgi:hypothetical protein